MPKNDQKSMKKAILGIYKIIKKCAPLKLVDHAGIDREKVHFIRLGTSGGIGCDPGTIVVSNTAMNGEMKNVFRSVECGKVVELPAKFSAESNLVGQEILKVA